MAAAQGARYLPLTINRALNLTRCTRYTQAALARFLPLPQATRPWGGTRTDPCTPFAPACSPYERPSLMRRLSLRQKIEADTD